jgi:hypothetical protein
MSSEHILECRLHFFKYHLTEIMMSKSTKFIFVIALVLTLCNCRDNNAAVDPIPAVSGEVLATVNGAPITKQEVLFLITNNRRYEAEEAPAPAMIKKVLEGIILQEIVSQKAVEIGLEDTAVYQEQLQKMRIQLANFKRKQLSKVFYRHEVTMKADVTDTEALAYATENAARLQNEVLVWQILHKDRKQIEQVKADLDRGESFEFVAARRFPNLPESNPTPWELDYLNWEQVPDAWWDSLDDLALGETSGIIQESNRKFWIIKLVGKRNFADYNYETSKQRIKAILKKDKIKNLRESTISALRENAKIVYPKP